MSGTDGWMHMPCVPAPDGSNDATVCKGGSTPSPAIVPAMELIHEADCSANVLHAFAIPPMQL